MELGKLMRNFYTSGSEDDLVALPARGLPALILVCHLLPQLVQADPVGYGRAKINIRDMNHSIPKLGEFL